MHTHYYIYSLYHVISVSFKFNNIIAKQSILLYYMPAKSFVLYMLSLSMFQSLSYHLLHPRSYLHHLHFDHAILSVNFLLVRMVELDEKVGNSAAAVLRLVAFVEELRLLDLYLQNKFIRNS